MANCPQTDVWDHYPGFDLGSYHLILDGLVTVINKHTCKFESCVREFYFSYPNCFTKWSKYCRVAITKYEQTLTRAEHFNFSIQEIFE